jgi:transcriptional regulator with XRE-family HTH domain
VFNVVLEVYMSKQEVSEDLHQIRVGNRVFSVSDVGALCREARKIRHDTLQLVADLVGLSVAGLSRIETGQNQPKGRTMTLILQYVFGDDAVIQHVTQSLGQPFQPPSMKRLLEQVLRQELPELTLEDIQTVVVVAERVLLYRQRILALERERTAVLR